MTKCVFCQEAGGEILREDDYCRAVWAYETDYPGLCRVIWDRHVREMTDLDPEQRGHLLRVVFALEKSLIEVLEPDKINLASLGNQVPHLHWHVVPRFKDDPHWPFAIWGRRARDGGHPLPAEFSSSMRRALDAALKTKRGLIRSS